MARSIIYIRSKRKDGKFNVTFVFPLNGVSIRKVVSQEELDLQQAAGSQIVTLPTHDKIIERGFICMNAGDL